MDFDFDIAEINMEELQEAQRVLKARFPEMIEAYLEDAEMYLKRIEEGLASNDLEKAVKNAHPLKSGSSGLGVMGISKIARAIEITAKDSGSVESIQLMVAPLKDALEQVTPKLRAIVDRIA